MSAVKLKFGESKWSNLSPASCYIRSYLTICPLFSYALPMTRGVPVSEDIKRHALARLVENDGNAKRTARELGISRVNLIHWRNLSTDPLVYNTIDLDLRRSRAERWGAVQDLAANRMAALIPNETELDAVTKAAQISSQQYLDHRDGRRGTVVNLDQSQHVHITGDQAVTLLLEAKKQLQLGGPGNAAAGENQE